MRLGKISSAGMGLALIVCVYMILAGLYAFFTPAWESPDEPSHYLYTVYLAEQARPPGPSPIQLGGQFYSGGYVTSMYEWYHPALGYLWQALVWRMIQSVDPALLPHSFPAVNPRFGLDPFHTAHLFESDRVSPLPLAETDVGIILLRLASALPGAALVVVAFLSARQVAPRQTGFALTAAGLVALIPQFTFISSSIRNDTMNNLMVGLCILVLLKLIANPSRHTTRLALATGALLGIMLLTKAIAMFLLPVALLAIWLAPYPARQRVGIGIGGAMAGALVVGVYLLGFPEARLALNYSFHHAAPKPAYLSLAYLKSVVIPLRDMFWARFGWANVKGPDGWISAATLLTLIGMTITLLRWLSAYFKRTLSPIENRQLLVLSSAGLLNLVTVVVYNLYDYQPQGRFLFPSLIPFGILTLWGIWHILSPRLRMGLAVAALASLFLFNILSLIYYLIPAYYAALP